MTFNVGALVRARGREWVVLPESEDDVLVLRPLGGTDDEVTGICTTLESVESASFPLPVADPKQLGDHLSCRLLREAVRLSVRSAAGPFRSFGRLGFEPRSYQLVPLLLALRHDPVRLLIADDVGIGKTIEAGLVARELLDRAEVRRLAVICPPHLAEQWKAELASKFNLEAELVLASTVAKLERGKRVDESLFDRYPYTVVSMDFIKSDRRRYEFSRSAPELIIVDEAHTCTEMGDGHRGSRQQRHQLLKELAQDPNRHMLLVTATPHSGKEEAFRSLLSLLSVDLTNLPSDMTGSEHEKDRRLLSRFFIQRRRKDIEHYLGEDTPFPDRLEKDSTYRVSPEYKALFEDALSWAREATAEGPEGSRERRVRWWSALALLRCLGSSPASAAATLRQRASAAETDTPAQADEVGRQTVMDLADEGGESSDDTVPGSDTGSEERANPQRRRLLEMARKADALMGAKDSKLQEVIPLVKELLAEGHNPIIFCRFIPTAEYVAKALKEKLGSSAIVECVTGLLPSAEREERVFAMKAAGEEDKKRILVCTDCLSEGINLQEVFDAVIHYDLSWNPTRHEQREGRVDRFGQPKKVVRVVTYYGKDNPIDGVVIEVLLKKHKAIRTSLGVSVPVPIDSEEVLEAVFEGLLLRGHSGRAVQTSLFDEISEHAKDHLHEEWENASAREKRSRTMFAQEGVKVDEVAQELAEIRSALGAGIDLQEFVQHTLTLHGATVGQQGKNLRIDLREAPRTLRDAMGLKDQVVVRFDPPAEKGQVVLNRTHPALDALASHLLDTALDEHADGKAKRAGVIRTRAVPKRTTLLLLRFRFHIRATVRGRTTELLAEEILPLAFTGSPEKAEWLDAQAVDSLISARPDGNVTSDQATEFIRRVVEGYGLVKARVEEEARSRAQALLNSHKRARAAAGDKVGRYLVEPQLPADVIGIYIYLPVVS